MHNGALVMKILIVDDDVLLGPLAVHVFDQRGHEAMSCQEVESALSLIEENGFDVVVVDMVMGEKSGLELIEMAWKDGHDPFFFLMSGYPPTKEIQDLEAEGRLRFIFKPFKWHDLVDLLERIG